MLFIVVFTIFFCIFRCLRVTAPFPVMYIDPLAVCIRSRICSVLKLSKLLISPIKYNEAPESKIQKRVIVTGLYFPLQDWQEEYASPCLHTFICAFSKTQIVLQNTLLHLEAEVKQVETAGVLSVSLHSEYEVMYLMLLSAKKALSVLILSRVIGKVSVLHSESPKGKEPRETVSDPLPRVFFLQCEILRNLILWLHTPKTGLR